MEHPSVKVLCYFLIRLRLYITRKDSTEVMCLSQCIKSGDMLMNMSSDVSLDHLPKIVSAKIPNCKLIFFFLQKLLNIGGNTLKIIWKYYFLLQLCSLILASIAWSFTYGDFYCGVLLVIFKFLPFLLHLLAEIFL